ncbi:hypothetical protein EMO89_01615 [Bifidobacterium tissieri]|uniref:Uncharacterized protein n=1 Tax=Bifidobacterium tissieri TaxID=1630162 RepID=A0A5M9ZVB2_9BIFI|nr:hypothetical protein [Bifidobacterium tissieri]KAA8831458.1 hypothetical protein EMO89_01615 [Bifidobacterium tissieri]
MATANRLPDSPELRKLLERAQRNYQDNLDNLTDAATDAIDTAVTRGDLDIHELVQDYAREASQMANDYYQQLRGLWGDYGNVDMPEYAAELLDPDRALWDLQGGFNDTDYAGLTYTQVKNGQARSGVTMADLWPDLSNVDDAQQFIADMIATSGRMTMRANIAKDPTKPRWARVCGGVKPCAFCVMLASRGFAYSSEDTASLGGSFHDGHCRCTVVPSWGKTAQLLEQQQQWKSMYDQAAQSAKHAKEKTSPEAICSWLRYNFPDLLKDGVVFDPDMRIPRGSQFERQLGKLHTLRMNQLLKQAVANGNETTVRLWASHAGEYRIVDASYDGIANFSQGLGGIRVNLDVIGNATSIDPPYQVMFHETSHMLDWILNGRKPKQYSELTFAWAKRGEFGQALWADARTLRDDVEKELKDNWRSQFMEVEEAEVYLKKRHRLKISMIRRMITNVGTGLVEETLRGSGHTSLLRAGLLLWRTKIENGEPTPDDVMRALHLKVHGSVSKRVGADLDDMLQAWFPDYGIYAYAGHFKEDYWDAYSRPHEAFAEMMSAQIANHESWAHIEQWFPESAKMYEAMVKEALPHE